MNDVNEQAEAKQEPLPLLSKLLAQEKPDSEVVIATVRDYTKKGLYVQDGSVEQLVDKAKLEVIELTLVYQCLRRGANDDRFLNKIRESYKAAARNIEKMIDAANPLPENGKGNGRNGNHGYDNKKGGRNGNSHR